MRNELTAGVVRGSRFLSLKGGIVDHELIGSAVYMPEAGDVDFLVLVDQPWRAYTLFEATCERCASEEYIAGEDDPDFTAWRDGIVNYVVTSNPAFYKLMLRASRVCAALGLRKKMDRVLVHRLVRDGWEIEPAHAESLKWANHEDKA